MQFDNATAQRFATRSETAEERAELIRLYKELFNKELKRPGCRDCLSDAFLEVYNFYKKTNKMAENKFQISRGVVFPVGFGTGEYLVYQNCTDEKAIQVLKADPARIKWFEKYPDNWQELISGKTEKGKKADSGKTEKGKKADSGKTEKTEEETEESESDSTTSDVDPLT